MIHSGRRIIPARAGFTTACNRAGAWRRDHPRSRGVYPGRSRPSSTRSGSSPLARGLQVAAGWGFILVGIIPARAGFTPSTPGSPPITRDHPRSRGVYARVHSGGGELAGSSPLARGLPPRPGRWSRRPRIIPARAGFTRPGPAAAAGSWDHPRSRGVYGGPRCGWRRGWTDHPRSRGVYGVSTPAWSASRGSSPLARGLRPPTGASPSPSGDHPRSRGVYTAGPGGDAATRGSSPLARGLR